MSGYNEQYKGYDPQTEARRAHIRAAQAAWAAGNSSPPGWSRSLYDEGYDRGVKDGLERGKKATHTGRFLYGMLLVFSSLGAACLGSWWGWSIAGCIARHVS